jgi:hypothetical protein
MYEWLLMGFWIGYWMYWPLTDRIYKYNSLTELCTPNITVTTAHMSPVSSNSADTSASVPTVLTKSFHHTLPDHNWPTPRLNSFQTIPVITFPCVLYRKHCYSVAVQLLHIINLLPSNRCSTVSWPLPRNECFRAVS